MDSLTDEERLRMGCASSASPCRWAMYVFPTEALNIHWYLSALLPQPVSGCASVKHFAAGSSAEGLALPTYRNRSTGKFTMADHDSMLSRTIVHDHLHGDSRQPFSAEPCSSDPRYVKLRVTCAASTALIAAACPSRDGSFVPRDFFPLDNIKPLHPLLDWSWHGPAQKHKSVRGAPLEELEYDTVFALTLERWPQSVESRWMNRKRPSGWPGPDLVASAVLQPCLATPVGLQTREEDEGLLWRLSFSLPERLLTLALTAAQRTVYTLTKLLLKERLPGCQEVKTFYIKNIFLWHCEKVPAAHWYDRSIGLCVLTFLRKITKHLFLGRAKSFFVPDSNLLGDVPPDKLIVAGEKVLTLCDDLESSLRSTLTGITFMSALNPWTETAWQHCFQRRCASLDSGDTCDLEADPERVLPLLIGNYIKVTKGVAAWLAAQKDRSAFDLSWPVVYAYTTLSIISRIVAYALYAKHWQRRKHGDYILSKEVAEFQQRCREALSTAGLEELELRHALLIATAFFKMKLRGGDPYRSGSFLPMSAQHLQLIIGFAVDEYMRRFIEDEDGDRP